jgi:hypothetical protein
MSFGRRTVAAAARGVLVPLALTACVSCSVVGTSGGDTGSGSPASSAGTPSANPHTADPDPRDLVLGDCFTADRTTLLGGVLPPGPVHIVPCTRPHLAEVFGRFTYVGGPYPVVAKVGIIAALDCANLATQYDMDSWTLDPAADPARSFLPSRAQWTAGDLDGVCFWAPAAGLTTGSLRRDQTTLPPDQYAYLDAADRPESALAESPQVQGEDDLVSYQNWTAGVADSFTAEAQLLSNHHWPARAQAPVDALVRRLGTTAPLWRTASQSPFMSEMERRLPTAQAQTTTAEEQAVRAAIGLTTTRAH